MKLFSCVNDHAIIYRVEGVGLVLSYKVDDIWMEHPLSEEGLKNIRDVLDGKSDNTKNLINLGW
jgi:hypothetical protein